MYKQIKKKEEWENYSYKKCQDKESYLGEI